MRLWGGIGGIVFTVGVLAVIGILGDGPPENPSGAKEYYDDLSGVLVYVIATLAVAGLVWFAATLHRFTGSVVSTAALVTGGGIVMISFATLIGVGETANELKDFSFDTSLIDVVETTSYFLITSGHAMIGLGAAAAGFAMLRTATLPSWLGWFSIVAGLIALASPAFFPMAAIWLWAVVTGAILVAKRVDVADAA